MMTKQKLKSTEALVKEILENDEKARNDDDYLYILVLLDVAGKKGDNLWAYSFAYFQLSHRKLGYPPFETVRRSRQKLQRKFPELRADKEVEEQRADNEETYRDFAREGVC